MNYLMSAMMYMKPISGLEKIEGEEKPYIFHTFLMLLSEGGGRPAALTLPIPDFTFTKECDRIGVLCGLFSWIA